MSKNYDVAVIGGGFYGLCIAAHMSNGHRVLVLEKEDNLMERASRTNQARVHTGFHYPRSFVTAFRSLFNLPRFIAEFRHAIVDDFDMLYAIARKGSKVNARRFLEMFKEMKAPIAPASSRHKALFNMDQVEDVFLAREHAFDYKILRNILRKKLEQKGVEVRLQTLVLTAEKHFLNGKTETVLNLSDGETITASRVFNCTYSRINSLLDASKTEILPLKHEITEVALVESPDELAQFGVTVMDGPFFSTMPFPAESCYSLTHVRYTPHSCWQDSSPCVDVHDYLSKNMPASNFPYMIRDAIRYMPCLVQCVHISSLFEVKSVLLRNESDDGRPIFLQQHENLGNFYSVLGAKMDNIYDLLEFISKINIYKN